MTIVLALIIAATQIGGYYAYYLSVKKSVTPNTTSWTIWTLGAILELISYSYVTSDWVKNILPIACSISCVVLYLYILLKGKFKKLSKQDIVILLMDFAALGLWYVTDSALVGNIAIQVSTIISFVPIYREVYDKEENETQPPWILWSIAYFLDIILVILRWEKWGDLAYPLTNFVLHFIMLILVFTHFKNKRNKANNTALYDIESHLYNSDSKIAGTGLFTSKKIKKGEVAFIMKGPTIHFSPKNKEEALQFPNIVGLSQDFYIDPIKPYMYINHTCDPNLGTHKDGISFIALTDIEEGDELTFDYSISEYSDWEMLCSCGADNCRKIIKSIDKLPVNFYKKYYPYIPEFFQKVYIKNHIENNN